MPSWRTSGCWRRRGSEAVQLGDPKRDSVTSNSAAHRGAARGRPDYRWLERVARDDGRAGRRASGDHLRLPASTLTGASARTRGSMRRLESPWDAIQPLAKESSLRSISGSMRTRRAICGGSAPRGRRRRLSALCRHVSRGSSLRSDLIQRVFPAVGKQAGGRPSGAEPYPNAWQAFAERGHQLLSVGGGVGIVLPSAFHANQSATGYRGPSI